ncbi:helix-turn-helix domain-containing protein [Bacillus sp. T33-2]|uniref:helix-turn-helix domain-containing protein n=1 Tax=Bacillus sp. T33-2 TaxID=2054168 RepID=UPI000C792ABE|nr:helix-turn-helix domain-containing protein [Bacillus sp. T33-2]PLR99783.1 RQC domain-containing protein [Bacillus sp. T33-2]
MRITYFDTVILFCLNRINGERTIYSLYHLFQGKKSSQTIQDAHLFGLSSFFNTVPFIRRAGLEEAAAILHDKRLIKENEGRRYFLTAEGKQVLDVHIEKNPLPLYLDGWKYHNMADLFWERLSLLTQVSSNLLYRQKTFTPVQKRKETTEWVKGYLKQQGSNRDQLAKALYNELLECLENRQGIDPALLIMRLSGYRMIGLTSMQAAERAGLEFFYYHLYFLNVLHFMLNEIIDNRSKYPVLSNLIMDPGRIVPLTMSTEKTFQLISDGKTIQEIARIRKLKVNTIEDHVVEIALNVQEFDIRPYVELEKQRTILAAARKISAKKLKAIRDEAKDATYFEIRLVLARHGEEQWN